MGDDSHLREVTDWTRRRTETPEERGERYLRLMAELREIQRKYLERGGKVFSVEEIDRALAGLRAGIDADEDGLEPPSP